MSRILVVGASGTVGSELSRLLVDQGEKVVKATSRKPSAADQVQVDLVSQSGLKAAFGSVERAFFLAPPGHANQEALLAPLIDEAKAHGLKKVVLMTAMGANADENAPMRKAERRLEASGLAFNIIRPNWFMQNFNTFWLHGIQTAGQIFLPVGAAKGSFIDARDIAAVAARLLTSETFANRDFDLTGPRALDHAEVAAILMRATGKTIGFTDISPDAMLQGLLGAGLPKDYAEFLVLILGYFKAGYAERTTDAVQQITDQPPRTIEQYAKDYRASWV
ncbi:SDR family oxidoreductase [uncultured Piscinibacter sp.]|uniref:SDR family oxidoreductase n=1 Tax=uncultured Piscinibacter sp. TaxID=1131835 RepID=UPI0026156579|nr:SDR family oxidoreductase [uncultured Piscinibacter sp.]